MAAANTGVMRANIRITKNNAIDKNGILFFLFLNPGAANTLRVINRFVNDIVVLVPANNTLSAAASWAPRPVKRVWDENGVINVHPDMTDVGLLHRSFRINMVLFFIAFCNVCHGFSYHL
jgi:hypothetical protein